MGYLLIRVHSFECDHPGCVKEEEHAEPSKRDAVKLTRRWGWYITADRIYCPQHWPSYRDAP
jgi:hypothetical protein